MVGLAGLGSRGADLLAAARRMAWDRAHPPQHNGRWFTLRMRARRARRPRAREEARVRDRRWRQRWGGGWPSLADLRRGRRR
jgi:hypothetical protein